MATGDVTTHPKFRMAGTGMRIHWGTESEICGPPYFVCLSAIEQDSRCFPPMTTATQSVAAPSDPSGARGRHERLYRVDPLQDSRWARLIERHPRASVFHSAAWLRALQKTYRYQPLAYTWSPPGEDLQGAILFCEVDSSLTGRRLVSLPFSDHCEPLLSNKQQCMHILSALEKQFPGPSQRYVEIRPLSPGDLTNPSWHESACYFFHWLDLRPELDSLFRNFHQSCIQRKIRRAQRENLVYREGSNESFLNAFYRLLVLTRKRHHLPPQPRPWFRNLMDSFGDALQIRLAFKDEQAVAGMLTIRHQDTLYYKNGGSDARFHHLGGMHFLFWNAIQDAKSRGLKTLDFGRVDTNQPGLITFKNRWGATSSPLRYYRFAPGRVPIHSFEPAAGLKMRMVKAFCSMAPEFVLPACGRILYRHIG